MTALGRFHDLTSRGLFMLAGGALVAALGLYVFEVVARYVFSAPTTWSGEAVQYALAVMIFAGLPEITRRNAHVAIDMIPEALSGAPALWLARFNTSVAALACACAAAITGKEAMLQLQRGLMTNAANPVPRWWLTAVITLGLASAALHLARQFAGPAR